MITRRSHYANAGAACLSAAMWGYHVAQGNAWMATLDVLLVQYFFACAFGATIERVERTRP